jgi:hypothetical protein
MEGESNRLKVATEVGGEWASYHTKEEDLESRMLGSGGLGFECLVRAMGPESGCQVRSSAGLNWRERQNLPTADTNATKNDNKSNGIFTVKTPRV